MPVLMLAVKGGYVISNLIFLTLSFAIIIKYRSSTSSLRTRTSEDAIFTLAFWIFATFGIGLCIYHQSSLKVIANYIPFILAPIAYIGISRCHVSIFPIWFGAATAGYAAFTIAFFQLHVQKIDRAHGFITNPIFFGNSAIIAAAVSLIGLVALIKSGYRRYIIGYVSLGAIAGIGASFYSGSKGGWISLPILIVVIYQFASAIWPKKNVKLGAGVAALVLAILAVSPGSPVSSRLHNLQMDLSAWINSDSSNGNNTGTASSRLEMWKFAFSVAGEHPILGFGSQALRERKIAAVASGDSDPIVSQYAHVHNEIMDIYLEHGLVGLSGLIFLFSGLFKVFYRHRLSNDIQVRTLALSGIIFLLLFLEFGLTNPQLPFNAPRNIFCGWAAVLAGLLSNRLNAISRVNEKALIENFSEQMLNQKT
jgi:O-antigen ligase